MEWLSYNNFKYTISHRKSRPWGDEIRFAVFDSETGKHIRTFTIPHVLETEKADIEKRLDMLAKELAGPIEEPERIYEEWEITELLRKKGILKADETLKDLKTLTELKTVSVV